MEKGIYYGIDITSIKPILIDIYNSTFRENVFIHGKIGEEKHFNTKFEGEKEKINIFSLY